MSRFYRKKIIWIPELRGKGSLTQRRGMRALRTFVCVWEPSWWMTSSVMPCGHSPPKRRSRHKNCGDCLKILKPWHFPPSFGRALFVVTGVTLINKFVPGDQPALLARKDLFHIRNKIQLKPASLGGKCGLNDNSRDFHLLSYIYQGIIPANFLNIKV